MVGIIIQARMGSTRLPGKILKDFEGKSLLEHIIFRLKSKLNSNAEIVIATSVLTSDDIVENFCKKEKVKCFRGDEQNVLSRYFLCAKQNKYDHIVRMTGDNPFPDIVELNKLIEFHIQNDMEFTENFSTLPIGVGMEIFTYKMLEESIEKASLPKHFEHADEYVLDNLNLYKTYSIKTEYPSDYVSERLTVDTKADYEKACFIIRKSKNKYISTDDAVALSREYEKEKKGV